MSDCPHCAGFGWLRVEGNAARRCRCRDPRQSDEALRLALRAAGLEPDELRSALTPWDETAQPRPERVLAWGRKIAEGDDGAPPFVVLFGLNGRGKTKAAAMTTAAYLRAGGTGALFVNAPEAVSRVMRERFDRELTRSPYEKRILGARLLVLDELGAEREGYRAATVEDWIRHRHRRRRPTLITTNAPELDALGDGRVASRLGEAYQLELLSEVDYRDFRLDG
jgi:DNA replication protein DnaC